MSDDKLGWWEKFCLRVGLCWDVPEPAAPSVATAAPEPAREVAGVFTLADKIEVCLAGLKHVSFFCGIDEPDAQDMTRLRAVVAERLRVEPHVAVIVELPSGSAMVVPSEIHFVEDDGSDFEVLVSRVVANRTGTFNSDFFRLDATPPDGPVTKAQAAPGQELPAQGLAPFVIKKETGAGGAPPPVKKRSR